MRKEYSIPEMEIIVLHVQDVITSSTGEGPWVPDITDPDYEGEEEGW